MGISNPTYERLEHYDRGAENRAEGAECQVCEQDGALPPKFVLSHQGEVSHDLGVYFRESWSVFPSLTLFPYRTAEAACTGRGQTHSPPLPPRSRLDGQPAACFSSPWPPVPCKPRWASLIFHAMATKAWTWALHYGLPFKPRLVGRLCGVFHS